MTDLLKELKTVYETVYKMKNYTTPKIYHGGKDFDLKKRWYVYYSYIDPVTGKMKRQVPISYDLNRKFKTVKERLIYFKLIRKCLIQLLEDGYSPYKNSASKTEIYTAESCLDFALSLKKKTIGKNTCIDYESKINVFKSYLKTKYLLDQPIKSIDKKVVNDFLNNLILNENSGPTNRNNYRSVLSSLFTILAKNDYVSKNFIKDEISILDSKPERNKTYDLEKANEILSYLESKESTLALLVKFVSYNFLRQIEVCRLQVKDLELNSNPKILKVRAKNKVVKTKIIPDIMVKELHKLDLSNPEAYLITYQGVAESNTYEGERSSYFSKNMEK
jgi:integrase